MFMYVPAQYPMQQAMETKQLSKTVSVYTTYYVKNVLIKGLVQEVAICPVQDSLIMKSKNFCLVYQSLCHRSPIRLYTKKMERNIFNRNLNSIKIMSSFIGYQTFKVLVVNFFSANSIFLQVCKPKSTHITLGLKSGDLGGISKY